MAPPIAPHVGWASCSSTEQGEQTQAEPSVPHASASLAAAEDGSVGDSHEPHCYVCMEQSDGEGGNVQLIAVCRCSDSGAMSICKQVRPPRGQPARKHAPGLTHARARPLPPCPLVQQCFITWLERELERVGEFGAFRCMICKEPYRLERVAPRARISCYTLGERLLTGLFLGSFMTGCLVVAYIMVSLSALLSGHADAYRVLVGGASQIVFQVAEIVLLVAFVVGSAAIILTFLWHSFSPCNPQVAEVRTADKVFNLRALDQHIRHVPTRDGTAAHRRPFHFRSGRGR